MEGGAMVWAVLCSVLAVGLLTYVLLVLFSGRNKEHGTHIDDFIIEGEEVQHCAARRPTTPNLLSRLLFSFR